MAMQEEAGLVELRSVAVDTCRAALARGPLVREGNQWRYGRRRFSNTTVKRLIDEGTAVRDGGIVRAARGTEREPDPDMSQPDRPG
jgi:hypothetical protein